MKKLAVGRYLNVIVICLCLVFMAGFGLFLMQSKNQEPVEEVFAATMSSGLETTSFFAPVQDQTQDVGAVDVVPQVSVAVKQVLVVDKTLAQHPVQYSITMNNYDNNKFTNVYVNVSGCALPAAETFTYTSQQTAPTSTWGYYFNYSSKIDYLYTIPQLWSVYSITYTYTSAKGSANGTYAMAPNDTITVASYWMMPLASVDYAIAESTLFIYNNSKSTSATFQEKQQYGTQKIFTTDTIDTINGATYITTSNNIGLRADGKYLKSWTMLSTGKNAKWQDNVYTYGNGDSKIAGVWEDLIYRIEFYKGLNFMGSTLVKYGNVITGVPSTAASTGHSGYYTLLGTQITNGQTIFNHANYGHTLTANWVETPNDYTVTWYANGGTFANGETNYQQTSTTFGQYFTMPEPITRLGYTFLGWYTGMSESSITAIPITNSSRLESITNLTMHARWEINKNLSVSFATDDKVLGFDLKITDTIQNKVQTTTWHDIQQTVHTFTNIWGLTQFEISNAEFETGWVFHEFIIKKAGLDRMAEEGVDYTLTIEDNVFVIEAYESLEITITSCIKLTLKAVSNFYGDYELNNEGGLVGIGSEEAKPESTVVVPNQGSVILSAYIKGTMAKFMGFYSEYKGGPKEEYLLSPAEQTTWTAANISATQTIYAIFEFKHYTVSVLSFSDEKNFLDSADRKVNTFDTIGGKVTVKAAYDQSPPNFSGNEDAVVANGYNYYLNITTHSSAKPNTRYVFVGFYTDFETMKSDHGNQYANITSPNPSLTMNGQDVTFYAKFVLEYAFTVTGESVGITSVSVGNASGTKTAVQYYVYGAEVDLITCSYDTERYVLRNPVWKLVTGNLSDEQGTLLAVQTIKKGIFTMPNTPVELSAGVTERFFTLTVVALYTEQTLYFHGVKGGTASITSSNDEEVHLGEDGGVMTTYHTITASVKYGSSAVTLHAHTNTNTQIQNLYYTFMGWYSDFVDNRPSGPRLDRYDSGGDLHISSMQNGATYYCFFSRAYLVEVEVDDRITDVVFDQFVSQKTITEKGALYTILASHNEIVKFEVMLARGNVDRITQNQRGGDIDIIVNETKTIMEFVMPYYEIYINITTKSTESYLLTLRSFFIDDMEGYYDDDVGFVAESGTVKLEEVNTQGSTVKMQVEESATRTLVATPGVGYSFIGWYKLRTEVSYSEILKPGGPSYTRVIEDWFNIYDQNTNPGGAYIFFSSEPVVDSAPIERLDKNLYVAVFVKNYNLTLMEGDKGIDQITFDATTGRDRNADGKFDAQTFELQGQNSYQIITAPYGTMFDVWTFIANNYYFQEYEIISGGVSLGHYLLSNGKILASDGNIVQEDDWHLNFFLYENIQILARTYTSYAQATVNIYTLSITSEPILSLEGGTFNGATTQMQTFEFLIGSNLIGFLQVNPGFVFSHFAIDDVIQPHGVIMPNKDIMLSVYFDRNAYILETHIKTIGEDEIVRDNALGGEIIADHSILFGDVATMDLVATMGYQLEGIYLNEACTILAPNYASQIQQSQQIFEYQFHYRYVTDAVVAVPQTPTTPVFTFYVVFKLQLFEIDTTANRVDLNTNASESIQDVEIKLTDFNTSATIEKGFYGQLLSISIPSSDELRYYYSYNLKIKGLETGEQVELRYFVDGQEVLVEETGFGCLADGFIVYFIMPLEAIDITFEAEYYQMNLVFDSEINTGTFDNQYVAPNQNGQVDAKVYYNFDNYFCDEDALKTDLFDSGVPYATKQGFKIVAYNTMPDRSGTDFIIYEYDNNDTLTKVLINDFVFETHPQNFAATITLYAIFDYQNIDMLVNYTLSSEVFYNGYLQELLQVEINNFNAEIPYIFTWRNANNEVVGRYDFKNNIFTDGLGQVQSNLDDFYLTTKENNDVTYSVLKLRSANQSGTYFAVVEIEGGMKFVPNTPVVAEDNRYINILQKPLDVYLDANLVYYGPTTLDITDPNVNGLVFELHTISGTISMTETGTYDAHKPPDYNLKVALVGSGQTTQDGFDLLSNYKVNFTGSLQIKENVGFVCVTAGVYMRLIDTVYYKDILRDYPQTDMIVFNMLYDEFEDESQRRGQGIILNYLENSEENFGKKITLSYDYRFGYGLYQVMINGNVLPKENIKIDETTLTFNLNQSFVQDSKIDIRIYVTNQSLVTAHYNLKDVADAKMTQVFNQTFAQPLAVTPPKGYVLEGWYFDPAFTLQVPKVWQKVGTQDIYAKWDLEDLTQYISLVVKDNGEIQSVQDNLYQKIYNANKIELDYAISVGGFTVETVWFRQNSFGVWLELSGNEHQSLFNTSQSGIYSFSAVISGGPVEQVVNVGTYKVEIKINPYELTLSDEIFDKTYNANTDLQQDLFVQGLKGQLRLAGQYLQSDVAYDENGALSKVKVINVELLSNGSEFDENYAISNSEFFGKILPLNVKLFAEGTKTYDGSAYTMSHTARIGEVAQHAVFVLSNSSKNAGVYFADELDFEMVSVDSKLGNFIFDLHEDATVTITQAKHNFVFKSAVFTYDGSSHSIFPTKNGEALTTQMEGVTGIAYEYFAEGEDEPLDELPVNAGKYTVSVTVSGDQNFKEWTQTATLTIKKVIFDVEFFIDGQPILPSKVFDDVEEIEKISVKSNLDEPLANLLGLSWEVYKENQITDSVKTVGTYKIVANYDSTNFEVQKQDYVLYTITGKLVELGDIFTNSLSYTYSSKNYAETLLQDALLDQDYKNICSFEIKQISQKNSFGLFVVADQIVNSGVYKVLVQLEILDPNSYAFENGVAETLTISVFVKKFEITQFEDFDISKIYDGNMEFKNAVAKVKVYSDYVEEVTLSGVFADKNVGTQNVVSFEIENAQNFAYDQNLAQDLFGTITKKTITISLLENQQYVPVIYGNQDELIFQIDEKNQKYVDGLVANEVLKIQISCLVPNFVEEKNFALSLLSGVDLAQVLIETAVVVNGSFDNYNLAQVDGGLRVLLQEKIVAELVETDNVYSGAEKQIFVKLNGILCIYSAQENKFVGTDSLQAPATVAIKNYTPCVNAGTYTIVLELQDNNFTAFMNGEQTIGLTYTVLPFQIDDTYAETIALEYGDSLSQYTDTASPTISFGTTFTYTLDLSQHQNLPCGQHTLNFNSVENDNILSFSASDGSILLSNFVMNVTVKVEVKAKTLFVEDVIFPDGIYTGLDQTDAYDAIQIVFKDKMGNVVALPENVLTKAYYLDGVEALSILGVGEYSVMVFLGSSNYVFESGIGYQEIAAFKIAKAKLDVTISGTQTFDYDALIHTPLEATFMFGSSVISNINYTIYYTSNGQKLDSIKDAGTYGAEIEISSPTFEVGSVNDIVVTINPFVFKIDDTLDGEAWWTKKFGEDDPQLTKSFTTPFGETVALDFKRQSGEEVGQYKVALADGQKEEFEKTYPNYQLANFEDTFGAFHILSYKDTSGQLTIELLENIRVPYSGEPISSIKLSDYPNSFTIYEKKDQPIDPKYCDLSQVTFGFKFNEIKDVGTYDLVIKSVVSTTHDDFNLILAGKQFVITPKTITVVLENFVKTYDANVEANIAPNVIGICSNDTETVKVTGKFADKNVGQNKVIMLALSGENAKNYVLGTETVLGSIEAREVSVVGLFNKTYDANTFVNSANLQLVNVCAGDLVGVSGAYQDKNVGENKAITLELSGQDKDNYKLAQQNPIGKIFAKKLDFAEKDFSKQYDNSPTAKVETSDLLGIIAGDEVTIEKAVYVDVFSGEEDPTVNDKYLVVTLGGKDKANYTVDKLLTKITLRYITLQYHFGDEDDYNLTFVNDGQTIQKPWSTQQVAYGFAVNYPLYNQINALAQPTRMGYDFVGWTLDKKNSIAFSDATNTNIVPLGTLEDNEWTIHLYATWQIKSFAIKVAVMTQNIVNQDYSESSLGGTVLFDQTLLSATKLCQYFTTHKLSAFANENYEYVCMQKNGEMFETETEAEFLVTEEIAFEVLFARSEVKLTINLEGYIVAGYNSLIWQEQTGTLVATTKFGGVLKLPFLTTYGHDLLSFEDEIGQQYLPQATVTLSSGDMQLWVRFEPKIVQIHINTDGGAGDENFAYKDPANKIIEVQFGSTFGTLPTLSKSGYTFVTYILQNQNKNFGRVDQNTVLATADDNLVLLAVWDRNANHFALSSILEESYYQDFGITEYQTFENPLQIYYNLGTSSGFTQYENAFSAQTGTTVSIKFVNKSSHLYQFAYWEINGQKLTSQLEIDGALFKLSGGEENLMLQITGFKWGTQSPTILAKFVPNTFDFEIAAYDENLGNVEVQSGVVQGKTLAGAKIKLEYEAASGYHLNQNRTSALGATITYSNNQILLENVQEDVVLLPVFSQNSYTFTITKTGYVEGIAYVKYRIKPSTAMADYVTKAEVKTGDIVELRIGLLQGFEMTAVANKQNIQIVNTQTQNFRAATDYYLDILGFVDEFNIEINITKATYNLSVAKMLYNVQTGQYIDTQDNFAEIQNQSGQPCAQLAYLEKAVFVANTQTTKVDAFGQEIENAEYKFVGWYAIVDGQMILVSTAARYQFDVIADTSYFAVFEKETFTLTVTADAAFGTIVGQNNETINRIEVITAGENKKGIYKALPHSGYQFKGWKVTYTFNDQAKTTITQTYGLDFMENLGAFHANVLASAEFEKIDISVLVTANRLDGQMLDDDTILQHGQDYGHAISIATQSHTTLSIQAVSYAGYKFVSWTFGSLDLSNYTIIGTQTLEEFNYDEETGEQIGLLRTINTLQIEFIGKFVEYEIFATFDLADVDVNVEFVVNGLSAVAPGVVVAEDGKMIGSSQTFTQKAGSTITCFLNIFRGFELLEDEYGMSHFTNNMTVVVQMLDDSLALTPEEKQIYSSRYKILISNFMENTDIIIWGDSQQTILNFAKLENFFDKTYQENAYSGYIKYYSNQIVLLDENQSLSPKFENCNFLGWSTTKTESGLVTNEEGKLVEDYWTILDTVINLYPIYEYAKIKVEISVSPNQALVNPYDFLDEVFTSAASGYVIENQAYYYYIGASFGLGVPLFNEYYHFEAFQYYVVNDENQIILQQIKNVEFGAKPFVVTSEKAFDYSLANNYTSFDGLKDGIMYITILCSVDINYDAENFYTTNCQDVIGGTISVKGQTNTYMAVYNQEVQLVATPDDGYTVKEWWVNGIKLDVDSQVLNYVVTEPTEFIVKFVGKSLLVNLDISTGKSVSLIGGNLEATSENSYHLHVGDIINLFAEAESGYRYEGRWLHSNGQEINASNYVITPQDAQSGEITLTPVFSTRTMQVFIFMPKGFGTVSNDIRELASNSVDSQTTRFFCAIDYFQDLNLKISLIEKYRVDSIILQANGKTSDITSALYGTRFVLSSNLYNNAQSLSITVNIKKMYWLDLITEQNLVSGIGSSRVLVTDFIGSGKKDDPYKISTVQDLAKLAYVINEGLIQQNTAVKNSYNGISTYYEIVMPIDLSARFWTPIGTSQNPFNCNMIIYHMPVNIANDTQDAYYDFALFDQTVLQTYSGLFGFLGENANIEIKARDVLTIVYIIGGILLLVILVVILIVVINKSRQEKLRRFDERNTFLFDSE